MDGTTPGWSSGRRSGRSRVLVAASVAASVAAALAGCGGSVSSDAAGSSASPSPLGDEPVRSPTPDPSRARPCPAAPGDSTGPAATVASVRLTVPRTAAPGAAVPARTSVVVHGDAPRVVLLPSSSGLAVLRGTTLVGWAGGRGTSPVPLPLTAGSTRPVQVVPETLTLVACDGSALPAGEYGVRAVVGYGGDPLDAATGGAPRVFRLVSAPVPITLT